MERKQSKEREERWVKRGRRKRKKSVCYNMSSQQMPLISRNMWLETSWGDVFHHHQVSRKSHDQKKPSLVGCCLKSYHLTKTICLTCRKGGKEQRKGSEETRPAATELLEMFKLCKVFFFFSGTTHWVNKVLCLDQLHIWLFCCCCVATLQIQQPTRHQLWREREGGGSLSSLRLSEKQEWLQIEDKQAAVSTR